MNSMLVTIKNVCLVLVMVFDLQAKEFQEAKINIEGQERLFVVKYPDNYNNKNRIPLIIALHGGGSNWEKFNRGTTKYTLEKEANKRNVLLIYPEGVNNHWNDGRKPTNIKSVGINDVHFISKLIDKAIKEYHVDDNKVFVTGMSNGGFMAIRLAQELPEKISSVAAVAAQMSKHNRNILINNPISFLLINGTQDPIVPFVGGNFKPFKFAKSRGLILSTEQTINYFVKNNQCTKKPRIAFINNRKFDKTKLKTIEYQHCDKKKKVKLVKVNGGGHTWPGGKQYLPVAIIGRLSRELNASETIVNFFLGSDL